MLILISRLYSFDYSAMFLVLFSTLLAVIEIVVLPLSGSAPTSQSIPRLTSRHYTTPAYHDSGLLLPMQT